MMSQEERYVKCKCGRLIGVRLDDGKLESRHQGRRYVIKGDSEITCTCGRANAIVLDKAAVTVVV